MKKLILALAFFAIAFTAKSQDSTYVNLAALWNTSHMVETVRFAIYDVAHGIRQTPTDSIYAVTAFRLLLDSRNDSNVKKIINEAVIRDIQPTISKSALKAGIKAIIVDQYNMRQVINGDRTIEWYYQQ